MPRNTKPLSPLAKLAITAIEDLKGQDVTILDVQPLTTVTDTMIVCTGTSTRHAKSLAQSVVEKAKEAGHRPLGVEGMDQGDWVLVDLGGVVVHAMQAQARAFYQLEKLWALAEPVEAEAKPKKAAGAKKTDKAKAGKSKPSKSKPGKSAKPAAKKMVGKSGAGKPARKSAGKKMAPKAGAKPAARATGKPAAKKKPTRAKR